MPVSNEVVQQREDLYIPTSLEKDVINCSDDRGMGRYVHIFGGASNIPYNLAIVDETLQPGSVTDSLKDRTAQVVPVVETKGGVRQGVHSDETAEEGPHFHITRREGDIGCGYLFKREEISLHIGAIGAKLVTKAADLRPELFTEPADYEFAKNVTEAHQRLAEREGFLSPGRGVAMVAIEKGAETMVVSGPHVAESAEINLWKNKSLDGRLAHQADEPLYSQDEWAVEEIHERIHDEYPYDENQLKIAHLIDDLGVLSFLGVELENIHVRRDPAEA